MGFHFHGNVQLLTAVLQVLCAALVLLVLNGFCVFCPKGVFIKKISNCFSPSKQSEEKTNVDFLFICLLDPNKRRKRKRNMYKIRL